MDEFMEQWMEDFSQKWHEYEAEHGVDLMDGTKGIPLEQRMSILSRLHTFMSEAIQFMALSPEKEYPRPKK